MGEGRRGTILTGLVWVPETTTKHRAHVGRAIGLAARTAAGVFVGPTPPTSEDSDPTGVKDGNRQINLAKSVFLLNPDRTPLTPPSETGPSPEE